MADNTQLPPTGTGTSDIKVATDAVTYSGDAGVNVQLMRPVLVTGSEGSKTVVDLPGDNTNGLDVDVTRMAALVAGTALVGKVSIDQVTANANEVVLKTGSTTAVTQATAANLNATVIGAGSAGTANAGVLTVQGIAAMTKLLVTPDSVALPANQSCNMAQVAGTATSVNSGNKDAGTQRVVIATDQVALTNALLITGSGTAGTAATGVQTVQGIASMTPVQVSQATAATLNCTEASAAAIKTAVEIIDNPVKVDDAGFTVASDSIMMAGNLAVAMGADPDTADANDAVVGIANRHRVPFVIGGHPNVVSYGMSITTAVSNTIVGPTIASGSAFVCTSLSALVDNDSTVFPSIVIGYGTANTPAFATTPGTAKIIGGHPKAPAGGGFSIGDGSGIIGVGASDEEVRITTVGTVGGNGLYILLKGYTIAI